MFRKFLATAVVAALVSLSPAHAQEPATITVTGEGQSVAAPDLAVISLGVRNQAETALEAVNATSSALEGVLARLTSMGIAARDVQTESLSLNQIWDRRSQSGQSLPGSFEASNILTVRVRDLDQLGAVLQAALSDGANTLSGLSFGFDDPGPLQDIARRDAVADAMAKAALYADAAGVALGPVLSITEGGGGAAPVLRAASMRMAAEVADVPVAAGETEISARVTMVFEIETPK